MGINENKKSKLLHFDENVIEKLTIKAKENGTDFKNYTQNHLINLANEK
jgi:hypothetical protein